MYFALLLYFSEKNVSRTCYFDL